MADHARKQIRDAAVLDFTGLTTTGARVFSGRSAPLTGKELPGLNLLLRDEAGTMEGATLGTIERTGRLILEAWAPGNGDDLDDTLDLIAAEVETRFYTLGVGSHLGPLLTNIGAPTTQIDEPNQPEAKKRVGRLRILFPVTYRTAITDPTTIV